MALREGKKKKKKKEKNSSEKELPVAEENYNTCNTL